MDTPTYFEMQKVNDRILALEEKVEYLATILMDKGIIPKPKDEKK